MKIKYWVRSLAVLMILTVLLMSSSCFYVTLDSSPTPVPTVTPSPIDTGFTPPPTINPEPIPTIPDFVSVISEIRPSVVAINVTATGFGVLTQEGAGSGWIIDASGLIVTNAHVVEGASNITATLDDGREFPAQVVRTDSTSDLAVVKINAADLKAAKVGDSKNLRVGDWVVTIGNSLGQGISATKGIVSALDTSISASAGETLYNLIQTDAAINPGNSGGPMVNLLGEVVGITSIKVAQIGVEGMGYAISTEEALPIITDLVTSGYVTRPWLGVSLYTVNQLVVLRYNLAVNEGAFVTQVASGSPADQAGIKAGDVITNFNGENITNVDDLNQILHDAQIGQQVSLTYYRGADKTTVSLTLIASPPVS